MAIHQVNKRSRLDNILIGDTLVVVSRDTPARCTKFNGDQCIFLTKTAERGDVSGKVIFYTFQITESGKHELSGDDHGEFQITFLVLGESE